MIYNSLDKIPLKLFLEILQTKNVSLLTDENFRAFEAKGIWDGLEQEFKSLDPQNEFDKILKTLIKIQRYSAKYSFIQIAIWSLRFDRDLDLENAVRSEGFTLREKEYFEDLDIIEQDAEALQMLISEESTKLPKKKEGEKSKATNIDEVILGYCSVTGLQFNTNEITVTQFYALKKVFDEKLKASERDKEKNKK